MNELTVERLRELLRYEPVTGEFFWLARPRIRAGKRAGNVRPKDGRRSIRVDCKLYLAARLAWLYMTGKWPAHQVDHFDTNPTNDAWRNLRDLPSAKNAQNRRQAGPRSSTGLLGVNKNGARFQAALTLDGRRYRFGTYDTPEQAHAAYVEGKRQLHPAGTL